MFGNIFGSIGSDREIQNFAVQQTLVARNLVSAASSSASSGYSPTVRYLHLTTGEHVITPYVGETAVCMDATAGDVTIRFEDARPGQTIRMYLTAIEGGNARSFNWAVPLNSDNIIDYFLNYSNQGGVGFYNNTESTAVSFNLFGLYAGNVEFVSDASGTRWKMTGLIQN